MRLLSICFILFCLYACGNAQPSTKPLTHRPVEDIQNLLAVGNYQADIMDGAKQSARLNELSNKFQAAVQKNYEWFVDYISKVPKGEKMQWHENLGVSKDEYEEMILMMENIEVMPTATERLVISKTGDVISFKGTGRLVLLDSVKIDLAKNKVFYKNHTLDYSDSVSITDEKNGMRSKWFGYKYSLASKELTPDDLKDLANLQHISIGLTVGRLEKNNRTLLDIKSTEIVNGEKVREIRMPLLLK